MWISESFLKKNRSKFGQMAHCVLVGAGGTVVLLLFLLTFLHPCEVINFVPWILGFNSALAGYMLFNRPGEPIGHKHRTSIAIGMIHILISYLVLTSLFLHLIGEQVFNKWDLLYFLFIGAACSELGAMLAIKYLKLS
ncbi:MAG: hypothetical protein DRN37_02935 [Thermoplasmata archaeon]|nr:MAG: hypothetical protein DRN37_02935 [Thermoplasmata archaeon]